MKFLWRTDVHIADASPRSRTDDWATSVLDKLAQVGGLAERHGVTAVIDGGDFFHVKSPSRNSHALIQRVAQVHREYPCPVYTVTGNHDVKYGDTDYVDQSPLGVLLATGVFKPLGELGETFTEPSTGLSVRVVGVPYHGKEYDLVKLNAQKLGHDFLFVAAHLLASQGGGEMFGSEDIVAYNDLLSLEADVFAFGHWHKNQGVSVLEGKHIVNVGSLTRGSLSEDNIQRIPEVVLIEFSSEGVKTTQIPLKVRPASEVFDLDKRQEDTIRDVTVDAFISKLTDTLGGAPITSLEDRVKQLDLDPRVEAKMLHYLETST